MSSVNKKKKYSESALHFAEGPICTIGLNQKIVTTTQMKLFHKETNDFQKNSYRNISLRPEEFK